MEHSTSLVLGEGEEALLALERAHGSSSAQQWSVLCEVLAEIRRQVGEALVAVADGQRRAAVADEHFLRERSKRESADAALRADLRCLGEQFRGEVSRCASDARDALNSCVADLDARLGKLQDFESEVQARNEALRQEFRVECGVSRSSHDQLLQALSEMRQAARVEAGAHAVAVSQTQEEVRKVEELLTTTARQHEERVDQIHSKFESLIQEERNRRERDASRQQDNVEALRTVVSKEASGTSGSVRILHEKLEEVASAMRGAMSDQRTYLEEEIRKVSSQNALLHGSLADEVAARHLADSQMALMAEDVAALQGEVSALRQADEHLSNVVDERFAEITRALQAHREKDAERGRVVDSIRAQVDQERSTRVAEVGGLQTECRQLAAEAARLCAGLSEVAQSTKDLEEVGAQKRAEIVDEARRLHSAQADDNREWARLLVDQVTSDVRSKCEAACGEVKRQLLETSENLVGEVRQEFVSEMLRLEALAQGVGVAQAKTRTQDKEFLETQARATAEKVRGALEAHSEFGEALEQEQRRLIARVNEGFAQTSTTCGGLERRVHHLEFNMQRVRGHLPILFADR